VRDGLKEVPELGTVVTCLRANKYVQFLDLDEIVINKQRNGKWVVEYDLASLDNLSALEQQRKMYSLPDEVTPASYLPYKNKRDDSIRYVELSNCDVIAIDNKRNYPFGLPMSMGAWQPLLQKEIINRVERSVSDRLIKNILILSASF